MTVNYVVEGGSALPIIIANSPIENIETVDGRLVEGGAAKPVYVVNKSVPVNLDLSNLPDETTMANGDELIFNKIGEVVSKITVANAKSVFSGSAGHTIKDNGTPMTARTGLNFIGATVTDNAGSNSTDVTIVAGADMLAIQVFG